MLNKSRLRKPKVYLVDKLIAKRVHGGRVEYLVKWKDWSKEHNSWEPKKNILDRGLIEAFERSLRRSSDSTKALSSRKRPAHLLSTEVESNDFKRSVTVPKDQHQHPHPSSASPPRRSETTPSSSASSIIDRRFRLSTVLDSAASASAAISRHKVTSSTNTCTSGAGQKRLSGGGDDATVSCCQHQSVGTHLGAVSTAVSSPGASTMASPLVTPGTVLTSRSSTGVVCVDNEERPKILLTIPRQRILACPPPGVPSSGSSGASQNSSLNLGNSSLTTDPGDDPQSSLDRSLSSQTTTSSVQSPLNSPAKFLCPVELPRRSDPLDTMSPQSSLTFLQPPVIIDSPPVRTSVSPTCRASIPLPKLVLSNQEAEAAAPRKKHQKRRRHRHHSTTDNGSGDDGHPSKAQCRSGSSNSCSSTPSVSLSQVGASTSSMTGIHDAPRLAPLRIQLPRSMISGSGLMKSPTNRLRGIAPGQNKVRKSTRHSAQIYPFEFVAPNDKCFQLVHDMSLTDVTVNGLTITIKECSRPDHFFGAPTSQLVRLASPPLVTHAADDSSQVFELDGQVEPAECSRGMQASRQEGPCSPAYADENVAPTEGLTDPTCDDASTRETPAVVKNQSKCNGVSVLEPPTVTLPGVSLLKPVEGIESSIWEDPVPRKASPRPTPPSSKPADPLLLLADEVVMKSAHDAPSSPGLLIPSSSPVGSSSTPRRVSTSPDQSQMSPPDLSPVMLRRTPEKFAKAPPKATTSSADSQAAVVRPPSHPAPAIGTHLAAPPITLPSRSPAKTTSGRSRKLDQNAIPARTKRRCDNRTSREPRTLKANNCAGDPNNVYTFPDTSPSRTTIPNPVLSRRRDATRKHPLPANSVPSTPPPPAYHNLPMCSVTSPPASLNFTFQKPVAPPWKPASFPSPTVASLYDPALHPCLLDPSLGSLSSVLAAAAAVQQPVPGIAHPLPQQPMASFDMMAACAAAAASLFSPATTLLPPPPSHFEDTPIDLSAKRVTT